MEYKYKIGNWVKFNTHIEVVSSDGGARFIVERHSKDEITGQICGAVYRYTGKIVYDIFDEGNNYLTERKTIILYQVRDGMTNAPYEVREEDLLLVWTPLRVLPWRRKREAWNKLKKKI